MKPQSTRLVTTPAVMRSPTPSYHGPNAARPGDRPGDRQHPRLCQGQGHRAQRTHGHRLQHPEPRGLAIGAEAWQMIGRTPGYIVAVRPLRQGAITDFDITERMLRVLLHRCGVSRVSRPRVLICVPSAITRVERRAVREAARHAGGLGDLSHRAADGGRHRGRTGHPRAGGLDGGRRRRRDGRDGRDLPRWRGCPAGHPLRGLRLRRGDPVLCPPSPRCGGRGAHRRGGEVRHWLGLSL